MLPRPGSQELICDLGWNWGQIKISGIRSSELEQLLKDLSLWNKKDVPLMALSGGMKRRVLIGKAPAGVDVNLRKDMTTHYIEEAEAIADRVGVMNKGELLLLENKHDLLQNLGKRQLSIELEEAIDILPESLTRWALELSHEGYRLTYTYDQNKAQANIAELLHAISETDLLLKDINTSQSSLEEIFINLLDETQ